MQSEPITAVRCFNQGLNILAVSKDHIMVKYDKRKIHEPVTIYSHDDFFA